MKLTERTQSVIVHVPIRKPDSKTVLAHIMPSVVYKPCFLYLDL